MRLESGAVTKLEAEIRELVRQIIREEVGPLLADAERIDEFLSTRAAAGFADVASGTIRRWIREGRLVGQRAGRVVRVRRADLESLLREGRKAPELRPEQRARRDFGDSR